MILVTRLREEAILPRRMHRSDAGWDLTSAVNFLLLPHSRAVIPTGLRFHIPVGIEVQIRPRSGLAAKYGITVLNAPGTIDAGYQGEIQVILYNTTIYDFPVQIGDRIAQAVPAILAGLEFEETFTHQVPSGRSDGGLGSTGV